MNISEVFSYGYFAGTPDAPKELRIFVIGVIICAIASYLIGSINWGVILSHKYGKDIRDVGSGNAGATNMMRTFGKKAGAKTFILDFTKAAVASLIGRVLLGYIGAYIAGFFCIVGHAYPIFFKFKGGKGVVAIAAMCFFTEPIAFAVLLLIYLIVLFGYRMVSLASIMVAALYPLTLGMFMRARGLGVIFAFLSGALVVYLHRANIQRIYDRTENKLNFKKARKESDSTDDDKKV